MAANLVMGAVKRSAQAALDLVAPKRIQDPLKALDLPRNLVRQGLEKAWDLGLRAGRQLGQDLSLLAQGLRAALRGIARREDSLEPSLEKTLLPRSGPRIGR